MGAKHLCAVEKYREVCLIEYEFKKSDVPEYSEGGKGGVPITHHVEFVNEITYHGEQF